MPKLLAGESLVLPPIRKHWIVVAKGMFWPTIGALVLFLLVDVLLAGAISGDARVVVTLAALVLLGLAAYWVWLNWESAMLTVTEHRVILEGGILIRTSKVIPLDRVQDVSTRQNLLGRILDYGSVEIDTAGAIPNELFTYVSHPEMLRDQVFVLSEDLRAPMFVPPTQRPPLYADDRLSEPPPVTRPVPSGGGADDWDLEPPPPPPPERPPPF
jgi:membrane protein YdbS with pleckstrin-like domain